MARGMEVPECVFCLNYKRYGSDKFVRPEDVHVCLKHRVKLPYQLGMMYVCSDFDFNGAETGKPSSIKVAASFKPNTLYCFPSAYSEAYAVAKFSDLDKVPDEDEKSE